jgi:exosortase
MTVRALETAARPAALPLARAAGAASLVLLLAVIYFRTVHALWSVWMTNDNYSHGPLVPLVSLVLAWRRRDRLAAARLVPDARGTLLVALACALQVAGMRADVLALQGYSLVLVLLGLVLTFLGTAGLRVLAFPIGYLVFMLTFPPIIVNRLGFALKEVAVGLSTRAAEALGVTLQRDGMSLFVASGELRVEHPCSGLRSLIALLGIGTLMAAHLEAGTVRRVVLVLLAIPVAIAVNTLRMTLLIVVAHYAGVGRATGRLHDVSGLLLYALALAIMFGLFTALSRRRAGARAHA